MAFVPISLTAHSACAATFATNSTPIFSALRSLFCSLESFPFAGTLSLPSLMNILMDREDPVFLKKLSRRASVGSPSLLDRRFRRLHFPQFVEDFEPLLNGFRGVFDGFFQLPEVLDRLEDNGIRPETHAREGVV